MSAKFKEIELRDEKEKKDLISGLLSSSNYATTHLIIKGLSKFSDWTSEQRESLCEAAVWNSQVKNILGDADVLKFFKNLLSKVDYNKIGDCCTRTLMETIFGIDGG